MRLESSAIVDVFPCEKAALDIWNLPRARLRSVQHNERNSIVCRSPRSPSGTNLESQTCSSKLLRSNPHGVQNSEFAGEGQQV